jgi:hypothetical protein
MKLQKSIARAGGLATKAGLARRYSVSHTRMTQLASKPSFPEAIPVDGAGEVYVVSEVDAWRQSRSFHSAPVRRADA